MLFESQRREYWSSTYSRYIVYMVGADPLTVVDPVCCVRHPHRDVGGEDEQPRHEDGGPRHRHRPHRDRGHGEHNRQEPGAGKV